MFILFYFTDNHKIAVVVEYAQESIYTGCGYIERYFIGRSLHGWLIDKAREIYDRDKEPLIAYWIS